MNKQWISRKWLALALTGWLLAGCNSESGGNGGSTITPPEELFLTRLSVKLDGVVRNGLMLSAYKGEVLVEETPEQGISGVADYQFETTYAENDNYKVVIAHQPEEQLCRVINGSGIINPENTADIRIECRSWEDSEQDVSAATTSNFHAALNDQGDAVVVWKTAGANSIYSSKFYSEGQVNESVAQFGDVKGGYFKTAIDSDGNAVTVWRHGGDNGLYSQSRIKDSTNWSVPIRIDDDVKTKDQPISLSMNASGEAMVVWSPETGSSALGVKHYEGNNGWTGDLKHFGANKGIANSPKVVVNDSGEAVAIWGELNAALLIRSSFYTPASSPGEGTWNDIHDISMHTHSIGSLPLITLNNNGQAVAIWNVDNNLYASVLSPLNNEWSEGALLTESGPLNHRIVLDNQGRAMALWLQKDKDGSADIVVSHYNFGSDEAVWEDAQVLVDLASPLTVNGFDIAMNALGEAVLLWEQAGGGGNNKMYSSLYAPDQKAWSTTPTQLGTADGPYDDLIQVVINQNGQALALWADLSRNIKAKFFK
ncbi:hypothetical protein ABMA57_13195 [Saccharospirillum sp. HFRX-1]|uniref:hypothetical protein n=1 Tax=unclassified Saccharospirillum TaxID=2633430 RepID=UPI0037126BA2